jgi:hypothetical protein
MKLRIVNSLSALTVIWLLWGLPENSRICRDRRKFALQRGRQSARAPIQIAHGGSAGITFSNRRVRTRMHGGVAGVGRRLSPLYRSNAHLAIYFWIVGYT